MKYRRLYLTAITLSLFAGVAMAQEKDGRSAIEAGSCDSSGGSLEASGGKLYYIKANAWTQYDSVDLHTGTKTIELNVANGGGDSEIEVWVGGTKVGTLTVGGTGGWNTYQSKSLTLSAPQSGVRDVKLVFVDGNVNVDWLKFSGATQATRPLAVKRPAGPVVRVKPPKTNRSPRGKPRIINTTDLGADPDDEQSMVRQLVCANEFDIEGLIVATGCWKKSQSSTGMLDKLLNAYDQVYDNLKAHADGYPTPEYLRSISVMGQRGYGMGDVGEGKDSPGSELIIAAVDKDDPRPVWVTGWGGVNNVAQAIWKVKHTRSEAELAEFISKLRVFDILGQDDAGAWLAKNFPDLLYIRATAVYGWQPSDGYLREHIQSHGPLGAVYPNRKWATEGDTPAFMHVYPNGLNDPDRIDQGGWGGRFSLAKKTNIKSMSGVKTEMRFAPYRMYGNTSEGTEAIKRWSKGYNNDFQARMDWTMTGDYSKANHHPVAVVNGDKSRQVLEVSAVAGSSVTFSAAGSSDPDGDSLSYSWSFYKEPSSYRGSVSINNNSSASATVAIPSDARGKTIHVVLEIHDDGSPNLYAYRRVIINVDWLRFSKSTQPASAEKSAAVVEKPAATKKPDAPKKPRASGQRLRVIMMSDFPPIGVVKGGNVPNTMKSDPDDMQSMVRFLLYANEFDVEGLIASAGTFAMEAHKKNILGVLDRYEKVYGNLKKHDPNYPTPDYLRSVTFEGKGNNHGIPIKWGRGKQPYTDIVGKGKDSEASRAIIAAADKPDPRPIWIGVWGGPREVAQAIWDVKNTRSEEELKDFIGKLRIFLIAYQDASHGWLMDEFPDLFIIESRKTYQGMFGGRDSSANLAWVNENIRKNHGPLCAVYPHEGMGCTGVCEGDSPTFMYLISANRGINNPEDPTQPSWGGQYRKDGNKNHYVDGPGGSSISRWRKDYQREFAERADWCVD